MTRHRARVAALPLWLLLLGGALAGCASSGEDAPSDEIKELQDRVLELQRKAAVAEVELARLRQQVADLMAKQGPGGVPSGAAGTLAPLAPLAPMTPQPGTGRSSSARRPASPPVTDYGAAPVRPPAAADRGASGAAQPRAERPEQPGSAGGAGGIDEMDIEMPAPSARSTPPVTSGSGRRQAAAPVPAPAAAPAPPSVSQPAPAATAPRAAEGRQEPVTPAVQALYDRGYTLYHQKHYVDAETSFQRFLQAEPNSELADNAQYWIGECRYSRGDMRGALAAFRETVARYPTGNKTPDALLKAGMSLESLGDKEGARNTYQEVLKRFPGTAVAAVAEERRAKLP